MEHKFSNFYPRYDVGAPTGITISLPGAESQVLAWPTQIGSFHPFSSYFLHLESACRFPNHREEHTPLCSSVMSSVCSLYAQSQLVCFDLYKENISRMQRGEGRLHCGLFQVLSSG